MEPYTHIGIKPTIKAAIVVVVCFIIHYACCRFFGNIKYVLDRVTHYGLASYIITYLLVGLPLFAGTYIIDRKTSVAASLGLGGSILKPFAFACLFAAPMFIGGLILSKLRTGFNFESAVEGSACAGFFEELYFRGFLFGMLFRHTRLGFIPSIFLGAILFASGHLYQSEEPGEAAGIFIVTFMGAVFFAWLYTEWNYNLWVPIFLHTLMNGIWLVFSLDENASGTIASNILRGATIALSIVFTIRYKKRKGYAFEITKRTLLIKNDVPSSSF